MAPHTTIDSLFAGDRSGLGDALKNAPNALGGMLGNKWCDALTKADWSSG